MGMADYALPYDTEGRRVIKCGLHFDLDSCTLVAQYATSWPTN